MNYFFGLEYNKENNRIMSFLWFIIIGIVAGYVAGKIMRGGGFGLIVNLVVGIIGGVLGGWLFSLLGIYSTGGIIGSLVVATIGAITPAPVVSSVTSVVSVSLFFIACPFLKCNSFNLRKSLCIDKVHPSVFRRPDTIPPRENSLLQSFSNCIMVHSEHFCCFVNI